MSIDTINGEAKLPTAVGFIGLGAMGKPMVANLAEKLPAGSHIYVFDVVPALVKELSASLDSTVIACADAKEVTSYSVGACFCTLS
jgi:3-hydroxyisobutyrate dehydrogenase